MDSLSLSNTISKQTVLENTSMTYASLVDAKKRENDTISNERIQNGDRILETYEVTSDAIYGGMGSVWRVHHQSWNTNLAMKRPQPRFFAESGDARKKQFIEECEHWINLGLHPNIVSCYYVREIGGVPTIFSEWMDGGSLKDRIADGSLYEGTEEEVQERILDIAIQAARGLQYSHENGLIHQDMKPGNLLLSKTWDAKVADFGLAKAKEQLDDKSNTAKTTGYTLAYCPAEQANGVKPEKWMDVYAWALTVLEMYAGKRLWETGADAKVYFVDYPAQCRITPSGEMIALLGDCLEKHLSRFADISDRLSELFHDLTGCNYTRVATKAADSADVLNNRALSFIDLGMEDKAEECWEKALALAPENLASVYNQSLFLWRLGEISTEELKRRCDTTTDKTDFSERWEKPVNEEHQDMRPRTIKTRDSRNHSYEQLNAVISPDGESVYFVKYKNDCDYSYPVKLYWSRGSYEMSYQFACYDARTAKKRYLGKEYLYDEETLSLEDLTISELLLTEDQEYLITNTGVVVRAATGEVLHRLEKGREGCCLCKDLQHCYTIRNQKKGVDKYNYITGDREPFEYSMNAEGLVFNEHTERLYANNRYSEIFKIVADSGLILGGMSDSNDWGNYYGICVSPDGNKLYGYSEASLFVCSTTPFKKTDMLAEERIFACQLSDDGGFLCAGTENGVTLWNTADLRVIAKLKTKHMIERVVLSKDGSRLLTVDYNNTIMLWDIDSMKRLRVFKGKGDSVNVISACDDFSRFIAFAEDSRFSTIRIWDTNSPIRRAPWEISRVNSYREQIRQQEIQDSLMNDIRLKLDNGDVGQALALLTKAESEFGQNDFVRLRRKLTSLCCRSDLIGAYEMARVPIENRYWRSHEAMKVLANPCGGSFSVDNSFEVMIFSETGKLLGSFDRQIAGVHQFVTDWCYSHSGRILILYMETKIVIMDADNASVLREFEFEKFERHKGFNPFRSKVAVSPDDRAIAIEHDKKIEIMDIETGALMQTFEFPEINGKSLVVLVFDFSLCGRYLTVQCACNHDIYYSHNQLFRCDLAKGTSELLMTAMI